MSDQRNHLAGKRVRGSKYYECPVCHGQAVLLVKVGDERVAEVDDKGNVQYFCLKCDMIFSVDGRGMVVKGGA